MRRFVPWIQDSIVELKRRRVFRAAAVYLIVAWFLIQVAVSTFPYLDLPDWMVTAVIVLVALGFPLALVLAWSLELTPDGLRPEASRADRSPTETTDGRPPAPARRTALGGAGLIAALVATGAAGAYLTWWVPAPDATAANRTADAEAPATDAHELGPPEVRRLHQVTFSETMEEWPTFSPDGQRLLFSRDVTGYRQLFILELESGQETQLTDAAADHVQPAWAPDGSAILYVRAPEGHALSPSDIFGYYQRGDIWLMELGTGNTRRLIEGAHNPSFSPDGSRIAFDAGWVGSNRVWVADRVGRNPQQVTGDASESVFHVAPRWSPDGQVIVFQTVEGTNRDLSTVHLTTRSVRRLTDDLFMNVNPVWAPTGGGVYFTSNRGGGFNLWRLSVTEEGSPRGAPVQVTMGAGQDVEPAPDLAGTRVAFVTRSQNANLWRLPVDPRTGWATGDPEPVVTSTREDSRGAWSPDGTRVAFNSDRAGPMNLFVHSLEDGSTRQVTRGPGGDFQPRWSPDGRRLVFFSSRSGNADIWTVEVETGLMVQLTGDSALQVNPFYSPDGRRIAFQSDRGGRKEVWVMDADGSNPRQLSTTGVADHFMLWRPDGRSIVFNAPGRDGAVQFEISLDGGDARPFPRVRSGFHMSFNPAGDRVMDVVGHRTLTVSPLDGGAPYAIFELDDPEVRIDYPVWSPDGRWVLFDRLKPGGGDIWLMELAARSP
jgi:Tol biopolymer transport system component